MKARNATRAATVIVALAALLALALPAGAAAAASPGSILWTRYTTSSGAKADQFRKVAVGPGGVIYAVGSLGTTPNALVLVKYSSSGKRLWKRTTKGPAGKGALGVAVAVDTSGNVIVGGDVFAPLSSNQDMYVAKYSAAGVRLWQRSINGAAAGDDRVNDMVLDPSGNVYICGYTTGFGTSLDAIDLKLNSADGTTAWTYIYRGPAVSPGSTVDSASAVAIDSFGFTYLSGYSDDPATANKRDAFTIRVTTSGTQAWIARRVSAENYALGLDIAVDAPTASSYMTGYAYSANPGSITEMLLGASSFSGAPYYTSHVRVGDSGNLGLAITVDGNGAPVVAWQTFAGGIGISHAVVSKYATTTDTAAWVRTYALSGAGSAWFDITTDAANNVFVAGYTGSVAAKQNVLVAKYTIDGTLAWKRTFNGSAKNYDFANSLATSANYVYVVGTVTRGASGKDGVLLKIKK